MDECIKSVVYIIQWNIQHKKKMQCYPLRQCVWNLRALN